MFIVIAFFLSAEGICLYQDCDFAGSYFGPLYLSILNIVVWLMLIITTCSLVRMLNRRFGEAEFAGPKCKFFTFLGVFSLSFFIRGTWDLGIIIHPMSTKSEETMAIILFMLYFFTEWLPIFVIYLTHLWAFHSLVKRHRERRKNEQKNFNENIAASDNFDNSDCQDRLINA